MTRAKTRRRITLPVVAAVTVAFLAVAYLAGRILASLAN